MCETRHTGVFSRAATTARLAAVPPSARTGPEKAIDSSGPGRWSTLASKSMLVWPKTARNPMSPPAFRSLRALAPRRDVLRLVGREPVDLDLERRQLQFCDAVVNLAGNGVDPRPEFSAFGPEARGAQVLQRERHV